MVFVGGLTWYATRVGLQPDYVGIWLPATLITGLGIGLTFPVLSAAAVSSLHPERFAVGSAVNQTARQVGGAFGVALLVVILGRADRGGGRPDQLPPPVVVLRRDGGPGRAALHPAGLEATGGRRPGCQRVGLPGVARAESVAVVAGEAA